MKFEEEVSLPKDVHCVDHVLRYPKKAVAIDGSVPFMKAISYSKSVQDHHTEAEHYNEKYRLLLYLSSIVMVRKWFQQCS